VKRLLLILMLLVLPLQSTWAVVATYCQHEKEVMTTHFGHHEHEHAEDDAAGTEQSSATTHPDCLNCHGAAAGMAIAPSAFAGSLRLTKALLSRSARLLPAPIPHRPERPKWTVVA